MNLPNLLILAIATWRISNIIALEHGPARLFSRLREGKYKTFLACIYCVSVWIAVLCYLVSLTEFYPVLYPFAISGLGLLIARYAGMTLNG